MKTDANVLWVALLAAACTAEAPEPPPSEAAQVTSALPQQPPADDTLESAAPVRPQPIPVDPPARDLASVTTVPIRPPDAAAAVPEPSGGEPIPFRRIDPGIEFFDGDVRIDGSQLRLSVVRIASPGPDVELTHEKIALPMLLKLGEARVAMSGGFASSYYPPIAAGYVQINGLVMNRLSDDRLLDGILVTRDGRISVERRGETSLPTNADDALQSGPILAVRGRVAFPRVIADSMRREFITRRAIRAFVGVDERERVLFGVIDEIPLTLLASFVVSSPAEGGLGCLEALNLSGSVNAGLIVRAGDVYFERGDMGTPVPTAIVIR